MTSKVPIQSDNVLNGHLVHVLPPKRAKIQRYSSKQAKIQKLATEKYRSSGRGINFSDVVKDFTCSKQNAQHMLKMACNAEILFRLPLLRTKPQLYS